MRRSWKNFHLLWRLLSQNNPILGQPFFRTQEKFPFLADYTEHNPIFGQPSSAYTGCGFCQKKHPGYKWYFRLFFFCLHSRKGGFLFVQLDKGVKLANIPKYENNTAPEQPQWQCEKLSKAWGVGAKNP